MMRKLAIRALVIVLVVVGCVGGATFAANATTLEMTTLSE